MRALIAERMVLDPASAANPRTYCQFGPLHTDAHAAVPRARPRRAALVALPVAARGLAVFFPFLALRAAASCGERARRAGGVRAGRLAAAPAGVDDRGQRGALPPALGRRARAAAGRAGDGRGCATFALAGLLASLAAVTRYDAWLALPMVAAGRLVLRAPAASRGARTRGLALFALCAALLPVAWLAWGAARRRRSALLRPLHLERSRRPRRHGRRPATAPLLGRRAPARRLGAGVRRRDDAARRRAGGRRARARGAARSSPAMRRGAGRRARRRPPSTSPRGSCCRASSRWPASRSFRARCCCRWRSQRVPLERARAVSRSARSPRPRRCSPSRCWLVATVGRARIWAGAESMGALTRLDGEDRALAAHLRAHPPARASA